MLINKITHKENTQSGESNDKNSNKEFSEYTVILSMVIIFSLAYIQWYYNSVILERVPAGTYEVKVGVEEYHSDAPVQLSTASIWIEQTEEYEEHKDWYGNIHTKTLYFDDAYLERFTYDGKEYYADDKELVIGKAMDVEVWDEDEDTYREVSIELCSNSLDLNTVGLTKEDIKEQRSTLSKIEYYGVLLFVAIYVYVLPRKILTRKKGTKIYNRTY